MYTHQDVDAILPGPPPYFIIAPSSRNSSQGASTPVINPHVVTMVSWHEKMAKGGKKGKATASPCLAVVKLDFF